MASQQQIVTQRTTNDDFHSDNTQPDFDPRLPPPTFDNYEDYEERYPKEDYILETKDIIFMAVRCATLFICLVSLILVLVNIARGNRLKSWRLYFLVSMSVFSWVAMTLYQDHIDNYFVQEVTRYPQPRSIFWCFRNIVHGVTLYLIILLLAHLSDMQHRSHWLGLIATVILVPLIYSVGLLIVDLRLSPEMRGMWEVNIAIDSVRVFLYNILTTALLFIMSRSFCTRLLYGTYSEQRSGLVVIVARWTFTFLLIHNLISMASYAITVISRLPSTVKVGKFVTIHLALDEAMLFVVVLAAPFSYLIGMLAQCCCGVSRDNDIEMDKVDKIYNDVWTTPSLRTNGAPALATAPKPAPKPATAISTNPGARPPSTGLQNGVVSRRKEQQGSNSTLDSVGSLPSIGTDPRGANRNNEAARKKRVRESYMEAVSTGSLNDDRRSESRSSMTSTEPIDL